MNSTQMTIGAAIIQALAALIMLVLTWKIAASTKQQSKNTQMQTQYMKTQINLNYSRKFQKPMQCQ